jgi:hypothetical protein
LGDYDILLMKPMRPVACTGICNLFLLGEIFYVIMITPPLSGDL